MSLGSPAEIIPFTRALTCRQRLQRIAVMTGTVVTPRSTDVSIRPSDTKMNPSDSFNAAIGSSTHEPGTLTVSSVKMIAATCP
jgi:hypothetical protein